MRRREFIAGLGSAVAWPLGVRAQQVAMSVVGFLTSSPVPPGVVTAFREGLAETGFVEGKNVTIEFQGADGEYDRLAMLAADFVARRAAVIFTSGNVAGLAAKSVTATVPIVFATGSDPIGIGLVARINRPEGNVTGATFFANPVIAKRLELLHELVPSVGTVGVLVNRTNPNSSSDAIEIQAAARTLGLRSEVLDAHSDAEVEVAFAALIQRQAGALFVSPDSFFVSRREKIVALAARNAIPTTYARSEYVVAGGLMSYAAVATDSYRQAGIYVGRILKGEKPADLPVVQPTKFELTINMKTAKTLGLTVPLSLQVAADEVIE